MIDINIDTILKLSCLNIANEKKQAFNDQLSGILDFMSVLSNVDKDPHPDFEWPINKDVFTRDDVSKFFSHPLVEQNAPEFRDDSFVVPKILKG